MTLANRLAARANAASPVRVGSIDCGKSGSMYLTRARLTKGIHNPLKGVLDCNGETLQYGLEWLGDAEW